MSRIPIQRDDPDPQAIGSIFGSLAAIEPGLHLVDATLPQGRCAGLAPDITFTARPGLDPADRSFLRGFRQAGGERELHLSESDRRPFRHVLAGILDGIDGDRPVILFLDLIDEAEGILGLVDARLAVIAPWPADRTKAAGERLGVLLENHGVIVLQPAGSDPFVWIMAKDRVAARADALKAGGARPLRRYAAVRQGVALAAFSLPNPPAGQDGLALNADRFIHDGGYRSESDRGYSWIWTGPSPHFRLLLPNVRRDRGRLVVSVIKAEDERNLAGMRVLVDGRPVAHENARWTGVDVATIALPPRRDDMTVVSLVCPHMAPDRDGNRLLGLCISKVEVLP